MKLIPKKYKGHGLHVYCNKCNRTITKKCIGEGGSAKACPNQEDWKYKAILHVPVPGTSGKKKSTTLSATTLEEAFVELQEIKSNFKENGYSKRPNELLLGDGVQRYLDKIHNQGEFSGNSKVLSEDHRKDVVRIVDRFVHSIRLAGENPDTLLLNDMSERFAAPFANYIKKFAKAQTSRDRHIRVMRAFIEFLKNRGMYNGGNFFKTIETQKIQSSPVAISDEEFENVLSIITRKNGAGYRGERKENHYKPWLADLYKLARYTGIRKEDLYELRWSDVHDVGDGVQVIVSRNRKVERILKKDVILEVIPVTKKLKSLLRKLEKEREGSESKLIETNHTWKSFRDCISRAFTHYYKIAYPNNQHKLYKQLRKSQMTDISAKLGVDAHKITGHTGNAVLDKHYIDKIMLAKKMMELEE